MGEDWESTGASAAAMGEAKRFEGFIGVPQKLKACGCRNALVSDAGCRKMRVGGHWRARKRKKANVVPTLTIDKDRAKSFSPCRAARATAAQGCRRIQSVWATAVARHSSQ